MVTWLSVKKRMHLKKAVNVFDVWDRLKSKVLVAIEIKRLEA